MRRLLTIALGGLVLSCQGPAAVLAQAECTRPLARVSDAGGQTASTVCSMAPKME